MKDLLLDVLSILFPILFYQFASLTKWIPTGSWKDRIGLGVVCGIAIISTMLFPDTISDDISGDLRNIPLILSVLYGGYMSGIVSFLCLLLVRGWMDVEGLMLAIFTAVTVLALSSLFRPRFANRLPAWRFIIAISLSSVSSVISWYISSPQDSLLEMTFIQIALIHLAAMCMAAFLIEVTLQTKRLQEQVMSSEKMNLASQLASSVAHEIGTPLTVVKGFLQLAAGSSEGKHKMYLETSLAELGRAEYVINDFLNYAKPQLEKPDTLSVADLFEQIQHSVSSLACLHQVEVVIEVTEKLWIQADPFKVRQALVNILKNSIEASIAGGKVSLRACRESDRVHIQVSDAGEGMTTEQLTRLGTPFYSTKNNGTGLGLMVAFRIIQAIGGHVEYTSKQGKGTDAIISLPMVREP
ncbi:ATP-binding protein [Paenibacillus filicis]|uniref:histidine kinase n=1 Tax=Paenibacillus filicis TaxID=669464 RepID=A0ABU9DHC2_9BACL